MSPLTEASGTIKHAAISGASSGNNSQIAAVTDKKIRVLSYVIVAAAAVTVKFASGTGSPVDLTGAMAVGANGGVAATYNPAGHFETAAGQPLNMILGGAISVTGHVTYQEVG